MAEQNRQIIINSRNYKGDIKRSWKADFIDRRDSLLSFVGVFESEINHSKLGVIRPGTISYEYYWLDRWYNVFRFHEPDGELRNYYCNLNLPPQFNDEILDYVDLEIDVLVSNDFEIEILDLDEFEENSKLFGYAPELITKTFETLDELLELIRSRDFPFS